MPRIVGIDLPKEKHIDIALTYIYGIGNSFAGKILREANIEPHKKAKDLTEEEAVRISSIVQKGYKLEGDLKREVSGNIKRLMEIGCYRGSRHKKGLPARGQRTRTNARTRKGPKRTVGSGRKIESKKS